MFKSAVLSAVAAVMMILVPSATAATPALEWDGPYVIAPTTIADIDCPTTSFCIAVDVEGNVATTTNPGGTETAWSAADVTTVSLRAVSCSSPTLCVAVGTNGEIATSTNPAVGAAAWTTTDIPGASYLGAVDCAPGVCAALDNEGRILLSSNPTGGAGAWVIGEPVGNQFFLAAIDCPSSDLCVATGSENRNLGGGFFQQENIVFTIKDPVGPGRSTAKSFLGPRSFIRAISCPTTTLCVAVDQLGESWTSTDPTGGASAWSNQLIDSEGDINDISCPTTTFCAAVDENFQALTTGLPTGGAEAWAATSINRMSNVACPSPTLCIASRDNEVLVGKPASPPEVITVVEPLPQQPIFIPLAPAPRLLMTAKTLAVHNGKVKIPLVCFGTGSWQAEIKLRSAAGRLIGTKRFGIQPNRTSVLKLPLNRPGRLLFEVKKRTSAKIQIKAQTSGQLLSLSRTITLRK